MADTLNNKPKLQLGNGFVKNGAMSPTPPTKLLINHGKPNFTIQRSPKIDEQRKFPDPIKTSPVAVLQPNNNTVVNNNNSHHNNDNVVLTNTKFYGVLNNVAQEKQPQLPEPIENGNMHKVALRRTLTLTSAPKTTADDNVPEFILRQRAIQERLAKENVLDFEKRRSGYFTQVVISPTSSSPTSFAETMSSPRINPALEIPAPQAEIKKESETKSEPEIEQNTLVEKLQTTESQEENHKIAEIEKETIIETPVVAEAQEVSHQEAEQVDDNDDDEVANAIEEVNKALAGEDVEESYTAVHIEPKVEIIEEAAHGQPKENGHKIDENNNDGESITISHTNGLEGPHIPSPDPSGELGVNFEPKTVVSFSKDLGADANKYPDTVKIEVNGQQMEDVKLKELTKVKFDIKEDENEIQVVPTIKSD